MQLLDALTRGLANKEIAAELGISADGVKRTLSRLFEQLDVPSRAGLVQVALRTAAARAERERVPKAFALLDVLPIPAILTRGREHRVQAVNDAWRALARPTDPNPDQRLFEILPVGPAEAVVRLADDALVRGADRTLFEIRFNDAATDDRWRHADVYARPLRDGAGEVAGLTLFFIDASDRVALGAHRAG